MQICVHSQFAVMLSVFWECICTIGFVQMRTWSCVSVRLIAWGAVPGLGQCRPQAQVCDAGTALLLPAVCQATAECPGPESQGSQMPPHSRVFAFATILPFHFRQAGLFLLCNLLTSHLLLFYLFMFCVWPAFHLELLCCLEGCVEAMHL